MNNSRKCPERMRTILQAMERSIEAARRSRMNVSVDDFPPPRQPAPIKPATFGQAPALNLNGPIQDDAPRVKARPKRLDSPLISPFQQPSYRPQTG